jgi:hypothetical protein
MAKFSGYWHITEMSNWDEDYFNMEVQAYIEIDGSSGEFQFGLVHGHLDGEIVKNGETERFEFTWDGNDECDEASGSGWLKFKNKNALERRIKLHQGDSSTLVAKRA